MDRETGGSGCIDRRFPRPRGDGPRVKAFRVIQFPTVSPPTRGWTRELILQCDIEVGFPAHAGMDPEEAHHDRRSGGFPAHAGMDLSVDSHLRHNSGVSPPTRGWTPVAPEMPETKYQVSPPTRGWTPIRSMPRRMVG